MAIVGEAGQLPGTHEVVVVGMVVGRAVDRARVGRTGARVRGLGLSRRGDQRRETGSRLTYSSGASAPNTLASL
jgi:hypothetical protein